MKKFTKKWISSKLPKKQRKYRYNADIKTRKIMMSSNLSKPLREKYSRRSFPIRKGDVAKVMIGEFKGKTGKVEIVNTKKMKVSIEGLQIAKKDGTKINVYFQPSNIQIQELNMEDKKRIESIKKETK